MYYIVYLFDANIENVLEFLAEYGREKLNVNNFEPIDLKSNSLRPKKYEKSVVCQKNIY